MGPVLQPSLKHFSCYQILTECHVYVEREGVTLV